MREKFLKPEAENKFHRRKLTYIYYSPLPVSPPSPLSPPLPVSPPSPLSPPLPFFPACFLSCCIGPFLPPFSPRLTCSGNHNPPRPLSTGVYHTAAATSSPTSLRPVRRRVGRGRGPLTSPLPRHHACSSHCVATRKRWHTSSAAPRMGKDVKSRPPESGRWRAG